MRVIKVRGVCTACSPLAARGPVQPRPCRLLESKALDLTKPSAAALRWGATPRRASLARDRAAGGAGPPFPLFSQVAATLLGAQGHDKQFPAAALPPDAGAACL